MNISAKLSNLRIAPRKARLVVDMIRNKKAEQAENILRFTTKKAKAPVLKLLNQAVANAKNNFQIEKSNLFIKKAVVDEGFKYKRWRPRSRGQTYEIQKKTSHITLVLDVLNPMEKIERKEVKKQDKKSEEIQIEKTVSKQKTEKPKVTAEKIMKKPVIEKGIKKIFRRKVI